MGFTSLEVEAQRKKINSLSSDEFISWSKKVAAERSAQPSVARELGTLEKVMPQALNPCYGIRQSNGAVSRYCAFGTTSVNISSVRFVSPGNSMGRVFLARTRWRISRVLLYSMEKWNRCLVRDATENLL